MLLPGSGHERAGRRGEGDAEEMVAALLVACALVRLVLATEALCGQASQVSKDGPAATESGWRPSSRLMLTGLRRHAVSLRRRALPSSPATTR
jgi:hypothetical protein